MFKNTKNHSFFLSTIIVGFFSLVILTIYLSSKNALPKFDGFSSMDATSIGSSTLKTTRIGLPLGDIDVEISDTPDLRERGLSRRMSLAPNDGMLFVFQIPGIYGFWMKDMNFPIDIVWIDNDHRVVAMNLDVATSTYPESIFPSSSISHVLELNAGSAREFGIATGTILKFDY